MQAEASLRVVDGFDGAWSAHDEEGVLDLFTDDAVATFSLFNETLGRMRATGDPA